MTTSYHSDYAGRCDHVMALAYGWSASGSTTAHAHWLAIPAADKHPGDSNVPAGGLAFFSGGSSGAGHVMISIGGGNFVSTDIHGSGTFRQDHHRRDQEQVGRDLQRLGAALVPDQPLTPARGIRCRWPPGAADTATNPPNLT